MATMNVDPLVAGYDAVYAGLERSPTLQRLWRQHAIGIDYPPGFEHLSFLTREELGRFSSELRPRGPVVDVGCGAGGPGLWVASKTRGALIGIDASRVALARARDRANHLEGGPEAVFSVGVFDRLPVRTGSVDAVMSVTRFSTPPTRRRRFSRSAASFARVAESRLLPLKLMLIGSADFPCSAPTPPTIFVPCSAAQDSRSTCTKKPRDGASVSPPRTKRWRGKSSRYASKWAPLRAPR
jgi:SAM-dependent methyltransferase